MACATDKEEIMLTKFKLIKNFAVYDDFDWDRSVRDKGNNIAKFKKLNIIYGRNYSGKTSLSRIIRSLELKRPHEKYLNAEYEFSHEGSLKLLHSNLDKSPYAVRVYNRDFVDENLRWLTDADGAIKPFAVLGEKNVSIEEAILEKKNQLGSVVDKTGLMYKLDVERKQYEEKHRSVEKERASLDEQLRKKANGEIKVNSIYCDVNYNLNKIKADVASLQVTPLAPLSIEQKADLLMLLKEEARAPVSLGFSFVNKLPMLSFSVGKMLSTALTQTFTIQDLLDDGDLERWVRDGLAYHEHSKDCKFCGGPLSSEVWSRLNSHFSQQSKDFLYGIDSIVQVIATEQDKYRDLQFPSQSELYSSIQKQYGESIRKLGSEVGMYVAELEALIEALMKKKNNIYTVMHVEFETARDYDVSKALSVVQKLIDEHNRSSSSLSVDQDAARKTLRLSEVQSFVKDIDYDKRFRDIDRLMRECDRSRIAVQRLNSEIEKIKREEETLSTQLIDERKGADKVNFFLKNHFGHSALQLIAKEEVDSKVITFVIMRNGSPAHNLSEGECSLVAFCYFVAKLEEVNTKGKELIIWIDDPISSLDSNHIYFIYSLIESVLTKPMRTGEAEVLSFKYSQLFISTHSLEFLKYLKKISRPTKDCEYFILERKAESSSIKLMPSYLRKYVTEFNYLFSQIYKCATAEASVEGHEAFYNFGNNLRKFLEAYLFYKYPNSEPSDRKLLRFFGGDSLHADLANRINNELSHLEEIFDRSMTPLDIPEIPKLASFVLETIKQKDPEQYAALVESIGEVE